MSGVSSRPSDKLGESSIPALGAIEAQLARILKADRFAKSERLSAFLAFVVRQHLDGNSEQLKEYSIGLAVFGKTPDFDPAANAVVRTRASRLRSELAAYYENEGKGDQILIELPKGHYIPQFTVRRTGNVEASEGATPARQSRRKWLWIAVGLLVLGVGAGLWWARSGRRTVTVSAPNETRPRRLFSRATTEGHTPFRIHTGQLHNQLLVTPDSQKLYAIPLPPGRSATVVSMESLRVKRVIELPFAAHTAFMPKSGKRIYITSYTPEEGVMVVDTGSDRLLEVIPTGAPAFGIAVTPDEKKIFLAMGHAGLKRIDLDNRKSRILSVVPCPMGLDMDPTRRRLYVSYQCGGPEGRPGHDTVDVYDVDTEQSAAIIKDLPMVGQRPIASPQGDLVLLDGSDACSSPAYDHVGCPAITNGPILHLWHASNHRFIASIPPQIYGGAAFFPHTPRLFFAGRELIVWDWARQKIVEKMSLPRETLVNVALTPGGDRAFVSTEAGGLIVFDSEKEECPPPVHGLANFYSGDGTLDDSQWVASLDSSNPPGFAPGRIGQAFKFNGKDSFLRAIAGGGFCAFCEYDWTESLFAKLDSTAGEMTILEWASGNAARARRLYKAQNNHIVIQRGDGLDSTVSISSIGPVETDRWYHFAVVTEKSRVSFYVNGILQGQGSIKQPFIAGEGRPPIFLGASEGKRNFLKGLIDEVAVYNRALSPAELKAMAGACGAAK